MKLIQLWLGLFLLCGGQSAFANTYAVGLSGGCSTHASLTDALAAAAINSSGPHLIKLRNGELKTGGFSLFEPVDDITIEGGYSNCAETAPPAGARMVIRQVGPERVLYFRNASDTRRRLELRGITLTGGDENASDVLGGGGALVLQNATLALGRGAVVEENRAGNGGGVGLFGTTSRIAELIVSDAAVIRNNTADGNGTLGNGGGVWALDNARIRLLHGSVERNLARRGGGGLALNTERTELIIDPPADTNPVAFASVYFNVSGRDTYSAGEGFGGGIYTRQGDIIITAPTIARFTTFITDNRGNLGGAIYAEGAEGAAEPFTFISIRNVYLADNQAVGKGGAFYSLNAVDWNLDHTAVASSCNFAGEITPCSVLRNNAAFNTATAGTPGGGVGYITNEVGSQRGIFRFFRTLFEDNHDYNAGKAAVAVALGTSEITFERCIFSGNDADTSNNGALFRNAPGINLRFVYNTVLDNSVDTLFYMNGGVLRNQGSILWSPGSEVWTPLAGASMENNSCLIAHAAVPGSVVVNPRLDATFMPPGRSAALDYCDNVGVTAGPDAYRASPGYDVSGVTAVWGNNDLGAIENRDILFFGGFGSDHFQQ